MKRSSLILFHRFTGLKRFLNWSLLLSCFIQPTGLASGSKYQGFQALESSIGHSENLSWSWWTDPEKAGTIVLTQALSAQLYLYTAHGALFSLHNREHLQEYQSIGLYRGIGANRGLELSWQRARHAHARPLSLFVVSMISEAKDWTKVYSLKLSPAGTHAKWQLSMHWQPTLVFSKDSKTSARHFRVHGDQSNHTLCTYPVQTDVPSSSSRQVVGQSLCAQDGRIGELSKELFTYVASYVTESKIQEARLLEYEELNNSLDVVQKIYTSPLPIDDSSHEQTALTLPSKLIFIECLSLYQMVCKRYPPALEEAWKCEVVPLSQTTGGLEFEGFKFKRESEKLLSALQTSFLFNPIAQPTSSAHFTKELAALLDIGLTNEFGFGAYVFERLLNFGMHVACAHDAYARLNGDLQEMRTKLTVGAYLNGRTLFTEHGLCLLFSAELWAHSFDASLWHAQCLFESSNHSFWKNTWLVGEEENHFRLGDEHGALLPCQQPHDQQIELSHQPEKIAGNWTKEDSLETINTPSLGERLGCVENKDFNKEEQTVRSDHLKISRLSTDATSSETAFKAKPISRTIAEASCALSFDSMETEAFELDTENTPFAGNMKQRQAILSQLEDQKLKREVKKLEVEMKRLELHEEKIKRDRLKLCLDCTQLTKECIAEGLLPEQIAVGAIFPLGSAQRPNIWNGDEVADVPHRFINGCENRVERLKQEAVRAQLVRHQGSGNSNSLDYELDSVEGGNFEENTGILTRCQKHKRSASVVSAVSEVHLSLPLRSVCEKYAYAADLPQVAAHSSRQFFLGHRRTGSAADLTPHAQVLETVWMSRMSTSTGIHQEASRNPTEWDIARLNRRYSMQPGFSWLAPDDQIEEVASRALNGTAYAPVILEGAKSNANSKPFNEEQLVPEQGGLLSRFKKLTALFFK